MPPRAGVEVPGAGTILLMGAHRHESASVTVKLVSVFPGHDPAHQAAIVVFDAATGTPAALMDGDAITAARTAAGSRLATRLLAREDADVLAVLGTGVQGDAHLRGADARARVGGDPRLGPPRRSAARDARPRATAAERRAASVEDAVRGAGVVCVATAATEPVLLRDWLAPGAHVNSVGFTAAGRELDPATRPRRARRRRVTRVRARAAARRQHRPRGRGRARGARRARGRHASRAARAPSS